MSGGDLDAILAALPRLTGDDVRDLAEAMPRIAGEWMADSCGRHHRYWHEGPCAAEVWPPDEVDQTWFGSIDVHPLSCLGRACSATSGSFATEREARAFCDAQLRAAGVALCGEVVTEATDAAVMANKGG